MCAMVSQITSLTIVCSIVHSGTDLRKHQSSRHWPLCGEFTGNRWIPCTNGQYAENVFIRWWHHELEETFGESSLCFWCIIKSPVKCHRFLPTFWKMASGFRPFSTKCFTVFLWHVDVILEHRAHDKLVWYSKPGTGLFYTAGLLDSHNLGWAYEKFCRACKFLEPNALDFVSLVKCKKEV